MAKQKSGYVTFDESKQKNVSVEDHPNFNSDTGMLVIKESVDSEPVANKTPIFNNVAYSMCEVNGAWNVIEIKYNDRTLETASATIVERNTEKLLIQERLTILLYGADIL